MNPILKDLLPDVYAGFPLADYKDNLEGWDGDNSIFSHLVDRFKPKLIVEVGTWKGQSAVTMAKACQSHGLDTAIICIDTWLGSEEHWLTWPHELRLVNGYPTLYRQFIANVLLRGLQEMIVPLPTSSITGAALLKHFNIQADMIYIDANHDGDAVRADIEHYYPLVRPGGMLFGHDLQHPPITVAVNNFCSTKQLPWHRHQAFWLIDKPQ